MKSLGGEQMSEKDIVKNYPGSGGSGAEINSQGATVSGNVGGATATDADGNTSPAVALGQTATANF